MNKHAYLIMAHKQPELLKKLISLLDNEKHDFFIHIDKKSNLDYDDIKNAAHKSNINFIERISVNWGGFSQIECELNLLKSAISGRYSYYHLLSGFDLPLKSSDEIYDFFENSNNKEFLSFDNENISNQILERITLYYLLQEKINRKNYLFYVLDKISILFQKIFKVNRLKNSNLKIQKGANWFDITHKFALYILSKEDEIYSMYKNTFCADEIFLQTLMVNSKFIDNLYHKKFDDDSHAIMRYIDWKRGKPYVFRKEDYNDLIKSDFLFARKFDEDIDKIIIDNIYDYLLR
ncbi:beta-1,6-N-acetylglucosaminyltransferase [Thomasclavelia cocleata]|uniref:beta-1,6-N-acetylglucosaminyltransferase n=1 Tax=Thomasclavelia cocleata TaxID=69824 RepID=UPI00242E7565|nr:beta-1,6-N-acetylglucosaminyltransferase [Thomasclavelia cocleata]